MTNRVGVIGNLPMMIRKTSRDVRSEADESTTIDWPPQEEPPKRTPGPLVKLQTFMPRERTKPLTTDRVDLATKLYRASQVRNSMI